MTDRHHLRLFLTFSSIFFLNFFSNARQVNAYTYQKDNDEVKHRYYDISVKKTAEQMNAVAAASRSEYKKIYDERLDELKEMLLSSRSVTEAEAYRYLQAVSNKIIAANPELKKKEPRIIFTRDWWPNAFSAGEGTIAINAGLFVHLHNEAELAFVLCHELAHYYLGHSDEAIRRYMDTINSESFKKELKRLSKEVYRVNERVEKLAKGIAFTSRRHSRDKESEADRYGVQFFKNTGYDGGGTISCLQLLDKSDSLSLYQPLDLKAVLSFDQYPFKNKWIQKESAIFSQMNEDRDTLTLRERDSLKTHPDCQLRIAVIQAEAENIRGKNFLIDEQFFSRLQKDFAMEIIEECYRADRLSRALYYNLQAMQNRSFSPENVYSALKTLNLIHDRQANHTLRNSLDSEGKIYTADYNLLLRMLNRIKLGELARLNYYFAIKYADAMKSYPGFSTEMDKANDRFNKTNN